MVTALEDEQAALLNELLQGVSDQTRTLLEIVIDDAPRVLGLQVAAKKRGHIGLVLRLWRSDYKGDPFHVAPRASGLTWWVRTPELRRGCISMADVEREFGPAASDRASDAEIKVHLETQEDVRRMFSLLERHR